MLEHCIIPIIKLIKFFCNLILFITNLTRNKNIWNEKGYKIEMTIKELQSKVRANQYNKQYVLYFLLDSYHVTFLRIFYLCIQCANWRLQFLALSSPLSFIYFFCKYKQIYQKNYSFMCNKYVGYICIYTHIIHSDTDIYIL